ncbi:hypothetical protein OPV22_004977 [Ensete ventricosum]|uniref:Uncharacterized protein n=1 Tax=Ensete ventricosum TaxID=4639 RepID=A0AAV8RNJ0_ENSVE|nr:hypothetical protein OPV22_004977 [Ensete ventricosum]
MRSALQFGECFARSRSSSFYRAFNLYIYSSPAEGPQAKLLPIYSSVPCEEETTAKIFGRVHKLGRTFL